MASTRTACALVAWSLAVCLAQPSWAAPICTVSASGAAFGTYTPSVTTPTDTTATVSVSCQGAALVLAYSLALGTGSSGNETARALYSGSNALAYQLYTDPARTQIWGDGSSNTRTTQNTLAIVVLSATVATTAIYGRIPPLQNVVPGTYQDMPIVTITW